MKKILENIDNYMSKLYNKNRCYWLYYTWFQIIEFPEYLKYLFAKPDNPNWISDNKIIDWVRRLKCRIKHHPCGMIWYNPVGYEPDYTCKNCGDELG